MIKKLGIGNGLGWFLFKFSETKFDCIGGLGPDLAYSMCVCALCREDSFTMWEQYRGAH